MTMRPVALVGMACRYAGARSPEELWENVLAQRRAFRRIPPERLREEDYFAADPEAPDRTYSFEAALVEDYEFDRLKFRIAASTYRAADLSHWLALDVAGQALHDAGFLDGASLPRRATGVFIGNTLTGEFSRANIMRLRWPYVRRVLDAGLEAEGWTGERRRGFLGRLEDSYKSAFPPVGEETLAGALSNTIAGRICNYFDLQGGGYTVDGACASSLLAIANACSQLGEGDLEVAIAGGVDLSLDPFEIVGFAKTRALASGEMRVYDAHSCGFWPGEGCGMVVLMRLDDAVAQGRRIHAVVRGWGISSDGSGGLTRPEMEGQLLALERAYERAGCGIDSAGYFEGHGTGTSVGDATELRTLSHARRCAGAGARPAAIGSVKANIGHTKAAAGVAGMIKAALALRNQVLPPTTGCVSPHPELTGKAPALASLREGTAWPEGVPLRAGISSMGFGGINVHVVLDGWGSARKAALTPAEQRLVSSSQDAELLVFSGAAPEELRSQILRASAIAPRLSRAELGDLARDLVSRAGRGGFRAAVVAATPADLCRGLQELEGRLAAREAAGIDMKAGLFFGPEGGEHRIGFLFPGQAAPVYCGRGAFARRFPSLWHDRGAVGSECRNAAEPVPTEIAQPAIVGASVAALDLLRALGVEASVAAGHSVGELTGLYWAGSLDRDAVLRLSAERGRVMAGLAGAHGAMARIAAPPEQAEALVRGLPAVLACFNGPAETVISGESAAVDAAVARARAAGWTAAPLPVSHAFHSPLVAAAAGPFSSALAEYEFRPPGRRLLSTITGGVLASDAGLRSLLARQITAPVRFAEAIESGGRDVDLWIEAGPGHMLAALAAPLSGGRAVSIDAGSQSLKGLLRALGAAFALGAPVDWDRFYADRFTRPFDLDRPRRFFSSPCEKAPVPREPERDVALASACGGARQCAVPTEAPGSTLRGDGTLEVFREVVAQRLDLPVNAVDGGSRLLTDLHLNSIAVAELVAEAARRLGAAPPLAPTEYADATIQEAAEALARAALQPEVEQARSISGLGAWVRPFIVDLLPKTRPAPPRPDAEPAGPWELFAPPEHPLRAALEARLGTLAGTGVVLCLPPEPGARDVPLLLAAARAVLARPERARFILVQQGGGGAAFARSLHLEHPGVTSCVVDVPFHHPDAPGWIAAEAAAARGGYSEAHYDASGCRREPFVRLMEDGGIGETGPAPLGPGDVLLISGGGKGIACECGLGLARDTGAALGILGRSDPARDPELAANLRRLSEAGVRFRYAVADVTGADEVARAFRSVEAEFGPVTAILHGAGANEPKPVRLLDTGAFLRTLAPKVLGAENLLAAADPERLRLVIAFGSLIARTGMRGEADYAVANEWLRLLLDRWHARHPGCRCLTIEWSVWSGVGMGERLGRVDALLRDGITPITPDTGVAQVCSLAARPAPATSVIVSGRFGDVPAIPFSDAELPWSRFLEKPLVHYPGIELIAEAELSSGTDLYLADHVFEGSQLLPAVIGLEAMAQAAAALSRQRGAPVLEDVVFDRPVVVPERSGCKVRIAALAREDGAIDLGLRTESTGFQVDHFRAVYRAGGAAAPARGLVPDVAAPAAAAGLDPATGLYGSLLFQAGRFNRVRSYRHLRATECVAELAPVGEEPWFSPYLPAALVLGDPGIRDAAIHAIQACIPHRTVLPIGARRIVFSGTNHEGARVVHARERFQQDSFLVYDVEIRTPDGEILETWEELKLKVVGAPKRPAAWPLPLFACFLERSMRDFAPHARLKVAAATNGSGRGAAAGDLFRLLAGAEGRVRKRPGGKPCAEPGCGASVSHAGEAVLAVYGDGTVGCDIEPVAGRARPVWQDLLGDRGSALAELIAAETAEDFGAAATRVWCAGESLKKAGAAPGAPLRFVSAEPGGWVRLASGSLAALTCVERVLGFEQPLAAALAVAALENFRAHGAAD